ncbi:MAG TPA: hypothetical protein VHA07_10980 [Devosia sp.]|nr:hypothetical protein [Devosia sp.]
MSDPNSSQAQLTPEARALIGRARRSFLFSIGLLIAGVLAIGGVIVYKSMQTTGGTSATSLSDYSLASVKVPAGAEVISASAAGGMLTVTFRNGQTTSIRIFDGRTGEMLREVPLVSE